MEAKFSFRLKNNYTENCHPLLESYNLVPI
jgi:hypothetical protein